MAHDLQTHPLPAEEDELERCAIRMGYGTEDRKKAVESFQKSIGVIWRSYTGPSNLFSWSQRPLRVRNTSDKDNFDIAAPIKDAIAKRGYRITQNPDEAHYRLQANVLSVAKTDPTAAQQALAGGFGGPLLSAVGGAAAGAAIGGLAGGTYGTAGLGAAAGGLAFAGAEMVTGALVKDVLYMVVTDVQVVEKAAEGVIVRQDNQQDLKQGIGGSQQQTSSEVTPVVNSGRHE